MRFIAPQAKLMGHLTLLGQLQDKARTVGPLNAEIDLSNRCSLGCEFCHFGFTHVKGPLAGKRAKPPGAVAGGDLMDRALAEKIVRELTVAGVRSITWTGGGEPTLHPAFDEIISFTAQFDIAQSLYTNGCHINAERADLLKQSMTFVYFSLDAANAQSYKTSKAVDRFAAACDGIRLLSGATGEATVGIGYLVTQANWREIPAALDVFRELGADYLQFRPTVRYEQPNPDAPAEDTSWMDEAMDVLSTVADHEGVEVDMDRFRLYRDWNGHGYPTCWWSMLQTCITPNGKVWTCVNRREHPSAEVGDLSREEFATIWARHTAAQVGGDCRVMCRGHLSNVVLDELLVPHAHPDFV